MVSFPVLRLNRHTVACLFIPLAVSGTIVSGAAAQDAVPAQGRWREDAGTRVPREEKPLTLIDVFACGAGKLCARRVGADGSCGSLAFTLLHKQPIDTSDEQLQLDGTFFGAAREGAIVAGWSKGNLHIRVADAGMPVLSRRSMPWYIARFTREGEARCTRAPVS